MTAPVKTCWCDFCKQETTYHFEPTRHTGHLIASIVTCGLWLPAWWLATYKPEWTKTKICDKCNRLIWGK